MLCRYLAPALSRHEISAQRAVAKVLPWAGQAVCGAAARERAVVRAAAAATARQPGVPGPTAGGDPVTGRTAATAMRHPRRMTPRK